LPKVDHTILVRFYDYLVESVLTPNITPSVSLRTPAVVRSLCLPELFSLRLSPASFCYEGLKHYFVIHFPQRSRALKDFIDKVLGPDNDITRFEYTKKNNREDGPALVGIELNCKEEYPSLIDRMERYGINYIEINKDSALFYLLI
jgi:hypothetical protein